MELEWDGVDFPAFRDQKGDGVRYPRFHRHMVKEQHAALHTVPDSHSRVTGVTSGDYKMKDQGVRVVEINALQAVIFDLPV